MNFDMERIQSIATELMEHVDNKDIREHISKISSDVMFRAPEIRYIDIRLMMGAIKGLENENDLLKMIEKQIGMDPNSLPRIMN